MFQLFQRPTCPLLRDSSDNLLQKNGLLQGFPGTDITTLVNCQ